MLGRKRKLVKCSITMWKILLIMNSCGLILDFRFAISDLTATNPKSKIDFHNISGFPFFVMCQTKYLITGKKNPPITRSNTNNFWKEPIKIKFWSNCLRFMKKHFQKLIACNAPIAVKIIHRGLKHLISSASASIWKCVKVSLLKNTLG